MTKEPAMRDRMEVRERSHWRRLLPRGREAVPRARKMVLPDDYIYPLAFGEKS